MKVNNKSALDIQGLLSSINTSESRRETALGLTFYVVNPLFVPKFQLSQSVAVSTAFRERFNDWACRFFGTMPTMKDGVAWRYGDNVFLTEATLDVFKEELSKYYIEESGKQTHASDCATSSAPAYFPGKCDCDEPAYYHVGVMNLYAWQPNGHGELSWFVMEENEELARASVEKEMARRKALPSNNPDHISDYECGRWGTDYYTLTVVDPGVVLTNAND
jgi:hypothetical protein